MNEHIEARKVSVGDVIVLSSGIFRVQSVESEGTMAIFQLDPLGVTNPNNIPTSYSAYPWQFVEISR